MQLILGDIKIKEFAPVVIPTLCRYEHLMSLLESLSKCRLADKTEVYIAVDYPARDSHKDGYNRICEYLDNVGDLGFKKINIIKRETNHGFGKNGNARNLINYVLKRHNRFIFTEDDNIFAPGYLEFMNYNLQKFERDKTILAVSGYMYPIETGFTTFKILKLEQFSAWGYGTWKDRRDYLSNIQYDNSKKEIILNDPFTINRCKAVRLNLYTDLIGMTKGEPLLGDSLYSILQIHKRWRTIFPSKSLVRNCGWDGSGTHGGVLDIYLTQPLETSATISDYTFADDNENVTIDNRVYDYHRNNIATIQKCLTLITYYLYKYTGKHFQFKRLRNLWKAIRGFKS